MRLSIQYAVLVALAFASPVAAQDAPAQIAYGDVGYGGTGCSDGTAIVYMAPDRLSGTILLNDYVVGDNGRSLDRATCAIAIPVDVPAGVQVAIRATGLHGSVSLPAGVDATINLEAFTAGDTGPVVETKLTGPLEEPLDTFTYIKDSDLQWSACGADINLRVNTSARTSGNDNAKVEVRLLNLYPLVTRAC